MYLLTQMRDITAQALVGIPKIEVSKQITQRDGIETHQCWK